MTFDLAVRREIYLSWKTIFIRENRWQLRKRSKIAAVVQRFAPQSHRFWHPNLVTILQSLLEQNVFLNDYCARDAGLLDQPQARDSQTSKSRVVSSPPVINNMNAENEAMKELKSSLERLYRTREYSDLVVSCKGKEYHVHKAVLCPRSDFFAAACREGFKEGREARIDLPEDDPRIVEIMVFYFYHLDYMNGFGNDFGAFEDHIHIKKDAEPYMPDVKLVEQPESAPIEFNTEGLEIYWTSSSDLITHVCVYALAEKYSIQSLKNLARQRFEMVALEHWASQEFLDAVQEAYISTVETDRGLRDLIVKVFHEHTELLDREESKAVFKATDTLAYDLLMFNHSMAFR
jgi:hypothetical protein